MLGPVTKFHPLATRAFHPLATRAFHPLAMRAFHPLTTRALRPLAMRASRPTPTKPWTRLIHDSFETGTNHHSRSEPFSEKHPGPNEEAVEEDPDATKGDDIKQRIGILEVLYKHVICKGQADLQGGIQEVKAEIKEIRNNMNSQIEGIRGEVRAWLFFIIGTIFFTVGLKLFYYDTAQKKDMEEGFGKQLSASQKEVEGKIGEVLVR